MRIYFDLIPRTSGPYIIPNIQIYGQGNVQLLPEKIFYEIGDVVEIKAIPATGWQFNTWRGASISLNNTETLTVTNHLNLIARFKKPQTKRVYIGDINPIHANQVKDAFLQSYFDCTGNNFDENNIIINIAGTLIDHLETVDLYGSDVLIRSNTGINNIWCQKYYPTLCFLPAGSNEHTQQYNSFNDLPNNQCAIICGCGTTHNLNAYDIETFADDPFNHLHTSFSLPYVAGIIVAAVDNFYNYNGFKDYAAARYYLRKGKVWNNENGYGFLDYTELTDLVNVNEYLVNIALDPDYYRKLDQYLLQ